MPNNLGDAIQKAISSSLSQVGSNVGSAVESAMRKWLAQMGAGSSAGATAAAQQGTTGSTISITGDVHMSVYGNVIVQGSGAGGGGGSGDPAGDAAGRGMASASRGWVEHYAGYLGVGLGTAGAIGSAYYGFSEAMINASSMSDQQIQAMQTRAYGQGMGIVGSSLQSIGSVAMLTHPGMGIAVSGLGVALGAAQSGMNYQASVLEQMGIGQQISSGIASFTGMSAGSTGAFFNSFSPRQAVANQFMQGFANQTGNPYSMSMQDYADIAKTTFSDALPEGSPDITNMRVRGMASLASMYPENLGQSGLKVFRDRYVTGSERRMVESPETFDQYMDRSHPDIQSYRGGSVAPIANAIAQNYQGEYAANRKTTASYQDFDTYDENALSLAALLGGDAALNAMSDAKIDQQTIRRIAGGPYAGYKMAGLAGGAFGAMGEGGVAMAGALSGNRGMRQYVGGQMGYGAGQEDYAIGGVLRQASGRMGQQAEYTAQQIRTLDALAYDRDQDGNISNIKSMEAAQGVEQLRAAHAGQLGRQGDLMNTAARTDFGLSMGDVGIKQAGYEARAMRANFYGTPEDLLRENLKQPDILADRIGATKQYLNEEGDPMKRREAEASLITLIQQHAIAVEKSIRSFDAMNIAVASTSANIASADQRRASILGIGGTAGGAYAEQTYKAAQGVTIAARTAANDIASQLRQQGKTEEEINRNPDFVKANSSYHEAQANEAGMSVARADVPNSVGVRRQYSADSFAFNMLHSMPMSLGSITGAGRATLRDIQAKMTEDNARYQQLEQSGQLNGEAGEAIKERFQQRKQANALEYSQIYGELSYGWEARIASYAMNAPSGISFISPQVAAKIAVGNGVSAPFLGSRDGKTPDWLQGLTNPGSLAGSWNDSSGMAAISGRSMQGDGVFSPVAPMGSGGSIMITGTLDIPGLGTATLNGSTIQRDVAHQTLRSNQQDNSAAGIAETLQSFGLIGRQ